MKNREFMTINIVGDNNSKELAGAFESLLFQDDKSFEIIFRDNDSDDNSYEVAIDYSKRFKEIGVFMSVSRNKGRMEESDVQTIMIRESEGLYQYYLEPVSPVKPDFVSKVIDTFKNNDVGAAVFSDRLQFCLRDGIADEKELVKDILSGDIEYNQIVFNRVNDVVYWNNRESFMVHNQSYRLFMSLLTKDVLCIRQSFADFVEPDYDEAVYNNLMYIFEKYRMIIAVKRKAEAFKRSNLIPDSEVYMSKILDDISDLQKIMEEKGKTDVAKRYGYLAELFRIM